MKMRIVLLFSVSLALQAAAPGGRYTDASGGVLDAGDTQVKDTHTGLIWERAHSASTLDDGLQTNHCSTQMTGNLSAGTWRLPTYEELTTLLDLSASSGPTIDAVAFPLTATAGFWVSTQITGLPTGVDFSNGTTFMSAGFGDALYVRCVR